MLSKLLMADYWQQKVEYDIQVTLIDSLNQISGHESLTYINNSPNKLDFLWIHLWPNAYKNRKSALAKQKFNSFSTKMHFLPDSSFGWIDINDVMAAGHFLDWDYRSEDTLDVAKFMLNEPLAPGDTVIIDLDFSVQVPNVVSRLGHFGHHYELTQWYPKPAVYDASGWHPMSYLDRGEFYSEWGDFNVSITLPKNYRVAATGVLLDSSEIAWRDSLARLGNAYLDSLNMDPRPELTSLDTLFDQKPVSSETLKTITFKQEKVHDFAWFADKRFIITNDTLELPSGKRVQTWTFALPQDLENYRFSNDYIGDAVTYFSDWFMEYPYEHATVVDGDFSAGGGMEYPMITLINNTGFQPMLELVIIHEVGHNWFYGLSGSNERDYPWMDEGLNSYAENRYWAAKYQDDSMLSHQGKKPAWLPVLELFLKDPSKSAVEDIAYYSRAGQKMDQAPNLHSEAFSLNNYGTMVYKKTALATESLHAYLGESLMDSVWHQYFHRWAFRHPQPEDIRQVFEEVVGEDLSWYFDDMLGTTNRIDYALDEVTSISQGDSYETTVKVSNQGDFSPPLAIGLTGANDSERKTIWVNPQSDQNVFKLKTDFPVQNVVLDPDLVLLDMNRANNDKKLHLDFDLLKLAINPQADYVVTMIPYIWYDSVDHILPGVILTHKNLIPWGTTDWYLRTFYGPVSKRAGFVASLDKKLFPKSGQEILLQTRISNGWYCQLGELSATFRKRSLMLPEDERKLKVSMIIEELTNGEFSLNGDTIRYLDQNIWQAGQYVKTGLNYNTTTRRTLWTRKYEFKGMLGAQKQGQPFAKVQSYVNYQNRYSEKGSIRTTIFAGYAMGDLPSQERFYLSTDMDTDMNNKLFVSRRNTWYGAGQLMLYPTEYTIPGYVYAEESGLTPSTEGIIGLKVQADIPTIESLSLLLGTGIILEESSNNWSAIASLSTVWQVGPVQFIYTPIRLMSSQTETDWSRFQIAINLKRSIRLGR